MKKKVENRKVSAGVEGGDGEVREIKVREAGE